MAVLFSLLPVLLLQPISECESVDALVRTDLDAISKDSDDTVKVLYTDLKCSHMVV